LERGRAFDSELFEIARKLVRLAAEKAKPNAERLKEYRDSALASLELGLYSEAPIYPEFEQAKLAFSMSYLKKTLPDSPVVRDVLGDRSIDELAHDLVKGTTLADVAVRRKIAAGGPEAIATSSDPMIKLALAVDPESRSIRKQREDQVEGVEASNYAL